MAETKIILLRHKSKFRTNFRKSGAHFANLNKMAKILICKKKHNSVLHFIKKLNNLEQLVENIKLIFGNCSTQVKNPQ